MTEPDPTEPQLWASALLVIDVQHDFLDDGVSAVPGTRAVLPAIASVLRAYRAAGRPIVHVVRLYRGADVDLPRRRSSACTDGPVAPGSRGSQLVPSLLPPTPLGAGQLEPEVLLGGGLQRLGADEVVLWKPRWSAFYRTGLAEHLARHNITTVVIAGCNLPNCPRATAFDASARDLRVLVVTDAVSQATPERVNDLHLIGAHTASSGVVRCALARHRRA